MKTSHDIIKIYSHNSEFKLRNVKFKKFILLAIVFLFSIPSLLD